MPLNQSQWKEAVAIELHTARSVWAKQVYLSDALTTIGHQFRKLEALYAVRTNAAEPEKILSRLVSIAAMAQRAAEDLGLVDPEQDTPATPAGADDESAWIADPENLPADTNQN